MKTIFFSALFFAGKYAEALPDFSKKLEEVHEN
jgi:hypothetical protein